MSHNKHNLSLNSKRVSFPCENGYLSGYLAYPNTDQQIPSVLLIHEVFCDWLSILKELTERLAKEGYLVMSVDLYTREDDPIKSFANRDALLKFLEDLNYEEILTDLFDSVNYLNEHPRGNGKVSVVGFCMGGSLAMDLATHDIPIQSSVVFYGRVLNSIEKVKEDSLSIISFLWGEG